MLPYNATSVIGRNEIWTGKAASEPLECGWAREAIVFLRALDAPRKIGRTRARVEISPDGIRWIASGTSFLLPSRRDQIAMARLTHFGNWIRVAADLPRGAAIKVLTTIHLKA